MGKRSKKSFKLSLTSHPKKVDRVIVGILICFSLVSDEGLSYRKLPNGKVTEASTICWIK